MKQVVENYAGVWVICILFVFAMAFTMINLHVVQARKIFNDIKSEVQASNGAIVDSSDRYYYTSHPDTDPDYTLAKDGFQYEYSVIRQSVTDMNIQNADETYIYNDLYKISLKYEYNVPLFGRQIYPMTGFAY